MGEPIRAGDGSSVMLISVPWPFATSKNKMMIMLFSLVVASSSLAASTGMDSDALALLAALWVASLSPEADADGNERLSAAEMRDAMLMAQFDAATAAADASLEGR